MRLSQWMLSRNLLAACKHSNQFRGQSQISTWLTKIVRNRALTRWRNFIQGSAMPLLPLRSYRSGQFWGQLRYVVSSPLSGIENLEVYLLLVSENMTAHSGSRRSHNVDTVLCSLQTDTQESRANRSRLLRVRLGMVTTAVL
jgi:hypothetical protein